MWLKIALALIVTLVVAGAVQFYSFHRRVNREIGAFVQQANIGSARIVSPADYGSVPQPVRRYFEAIGIDGQPMIQFVRLKQEGQFRTGVDQDWMPIEAVQYFSTEPPGFVWFAKATMASVVPIWVRDRLMHGHGHMLIKPLGLITAGDAAGSEMDQGSMARYLSETPWFPTALLPGEHLRWEAIDDESARAVLRIGDREVSGVFHVNNAGEIDRFEAPRYGTFGDAYRLESWGGFYRDYQSRGGIRIPTYVQPVWHLDSGDYTYAKLRVTEIDYNRPARFRRPARSVPQDMI